MLPPARILIVEDEENLADNLKIVLGKCSRDVRIAPEAETAMEMVKSLSPDLVVLDFALPGIDGLRAYADFVRVRLQKPSCVMIAGYPTAMMAESAGRQGIRHLLCKPIRRFPCPAEVDAKQWRRRQVAIAWRVWPGDAQR